MADIAPISSRIREEEPKDRHCRDLKGISGFRLHIFWNQMLLATYVNVNIGMFRCQIVCHIAFVIRSNSRAQLLRDREIVLFGQVRSEANDTYRIVRVRP